MQVQHGNALETDGFSLGNKQSEERGWRFFLNKDSGSLLLFSKEFSQANGLDKHIASIDPMTGVFSSISDSRYKTNIKSLTNILSSVMKLTPMSYHFLGQLETSPKAFGFLGQEVEKLFPALVNHTSENDVLHLNYDGFSVLAIKAIQEQQSIIQAQEIEIEKLKQGVKDMQQQLDTLNKLVKQLIEDQ